MIPFGRKARAAWGRQSCNLSDLGRERHEGTLPDVDDAEPVTIRLALGYVPGEPLTEDDEAPMWVTFASGPLCLLQEEVTFADAAQGAPVGHEPPGR